MATHRIYTAVCLAALLSACATSSNLPPPRTLTDEEYRQSNVAPECEQLTYAESRERCIYARELRAKNDAARGIAPAPPAQPAKTLFEADLETLTTMLDLHSRSAASRAPAQRYIEMVTETFSICTRLSDQYLDSRERAGHGMAITEECVERVSPMLDGLIGPALDEVKAARNPGAEEALKTLHAYAVASLAALTNYSQSIIELRQDRAARRAGIDERVARLKLELR